MRCPHCNANDCVDQVVSINVENYGDNSFHLPCNTCGEMVYVRARRIVVIDTVEKSDRDKSESDF